MKISYNWLKNYINTDLEPEKMSELLTDCGLEVEGLKKSESIKGGLKGIVIGKVLTCEKHPDADKLSVTTVDVGGEEPLKIVCGAPNVAAGQMVPVAVVGAEMYSGDDSFTIKKTKLRGVPSEGMICAEDELGLGASHDGIMVLDNDVTVGTPAKEYFNITEDHIFEIGLTPNRSDATSHIGVARDVKAVLDRYAFEQKNGKKTELIIPDLSAFKSDNNSRPVEIEIKNDIACRRYVGVTISNIEVKESPEWLQNYLNAVGVRPINNLVDISNFVMMETGQPLHFFDLDNIKGEKVVVRMAEEKEKFITLDEVERELSANDLMICDSENPMCIAGVFGGINSGITEKTTNIFIESAWFNPPTIRKTAKRHSLQTDASFRFERGSDIEMTTYALKRAALLIKEITGGEISSEINDVYPNTLPRNLVIINYDRVFSLIGKRFSKELVKTILKSLDIRILKENDQGLSLEIPTAKVEVTREADIVEEILRIYGYNNIEISHEVRSALSYVEKPDNEKIKNRIADILSANGFYEIMNNSLTATEYYNNIEGIDPEKHVKMLNPLSSELNILRRTLFFGGMEVISYNQNRKIADLKLYEFGKSYHFENEKERDLDVRKRYTENTHFSLFLSGNMTDESWFSEAKEVSFFDLKNYLFTILHKVGIDTKNLKETATKQPWFTDGLDISIKKRRLASIGKVAKKYQKQFDIHNPVFFADIDWEVLMSTVPSNDMTIKSVPKFPEVRRDLALLIDKSVSFRDIVNVVKQNGGTLVKNVNLFDVYEGDKLEDGKKSYAISLTLQDPERTLTDKIIDKTVNKLVGAFAHKIGATIR